MLPPSSHGHRSSKWQGYFLALENEVPTLEAEMSFLHKVKDNTIVEFLRVANQTKDP
jgi:hypothetical protein